MKYLHTYNESLRDKMVGKSKEEIVASIKNSGGDKSVDLDFKRIEPKSVMGYNIGSFKTSYNDLVKLFGEPEKGFSETNTYYWDFNDNQGRDIRIYDHKEYTDVLNTDPDDITTWEVLGYQTGYANEIISYIYSKLSHNFNYERIPVNEIDGNSVHGSITCSYDKMVELFGEPDDFDTYRTIFQWCLKDNKGDTYRIYDKNINDIGLDKEDVVHTYNDAGFQWNVECSNKDDYRKLRGYINSKS